MTAMTDTAAVAAIGAATRELHLPVIRPDAAHLAEIAQRCQTQLPRVRGRGPLR